MDFFLESHWIKAVVVAHCLDNDDRPALLVAVRRCNDKGRTTEELAADDNDGDTASTPNKLLFSACNNWATKAIITAFLLLPLPFIF